MAWHNPYFKRAEFACKCGECDNDPTIDYPLVDVLSGVRYHFNSPVFITSGYRCEAHNRAVGGSPNSQHLLGRAADIKVGGIHPAEVQAYLESRYPDELGLGKYDTFTHVDTRRGKARWTG